MTLPEIQVLLYFTGYDIPMSDTFLTMLADRIKPTAEVATALSVPAGTLADILARHKTYPTDGMKSMKARTIVNPVIV